VRSPRLPERNACAMLPLPLRYGKPMKYNRIQNSVPRNPRTTARIALAAAGLLFILLLIIFPSRRTTMSADYSAFDHPSISSILFHPRPESGGLSGGEFAELLIPVQGGIVIGGRIYSAGKNSPLFLFFHGNGEIVEDYGDLGPLYVKLGITFIPVDYRGYGRSGGTPSVSTMMSDALDVYSYVRDYARNNGFTGPLVVMGRSLGSASALEIASAHPSDIQGLIIESGFANAVPLLRLLGVNTTALGIRDDPVFRNAEKIKKFTGPTLVIHAERDQIIPYADGVALFQSSLSPDKELCTIPRADHNTIFYYGMKDYLAAVGRLVAKLGGRR
jgi:alpha-beta hydrolase superfamily lysophospholipase